MVVILNNSGYPREGGKQNLPWPIPGDDGPGGLEFIKQ